MKTSEALISDPEPNGPRRSSASRCFTASVWTADFLSHTYSKAAFLSARWLTSQTESAVVRNVSVTAVMLCRGVLVGRCYQQLISPTSDPLSLISAGLISDFILKVLS